MLEMAGTDPPPLHTKAGFQPEPVAFGLRLFSSGAPEPAPHGEPPAKERRRDILGRLRPFWAMLQRGWLRKCSRRTMESHMRSVPDLAEETRLAEAPSFEEFYAANFKRVFTALCLVTGDRHEAEEIAQDSFLRLYERWDRVGALDDPAAYLFRVSMNVFRNRYRRASLGVRRSLALAPAATDELAAVETHDEVVRLLQGLDRKQRAAVLLTAILDYSAEEAGRMLGVRASSVRSLTTRARAQMKHEVTDHES
jgi:RNA polymerase sigma factor (sigma-70 family)